MTTLERLGVGMALLILILDSLVGMQNFGPTVSTMAVLLVIIGYVIFVARGNDER